MPAKAGIRKVARAGSLAIIKHTVAPRLNVYLSFRTTNRRLHSSMKILMVNKFFYMKGGSERVFFQERDILLKHGYKVIDFSMHHPSNFPSPYSEYFVRNVDYKERNIRSELKNIVGFIHNHEAVKNLQALIKREKPDIAHLHNIYHQLTPSIIPVLKDAGVKVVLTLHDYKLICPSYLMLRRGNICNKCNGKHFFNAAAYRCQDESFSKSILLSSEAYWHKVRKHYESVDCIISPSKFLSDLVQKARALHNKVQVVHNGVSVSDYCYSSCDNNYILYLGRLSEEKGIELLLDSYTELFSSKRKDIPAEFAIKIVGTGNMMGAMKQQFKQAQFCGHLTGSELKRLIHECSFVVVPSRWYENFSMAVLESMACGKPIIASNIGGLPEQIEDGKTGFLFEPNNSKELMQKMLLLMQNAPLRSAMGKAAREKVEKEFSLEQHARKLLDVYRELAFQI